MMLELRTALRRTRLPQPVATGNRYEAIGRLALRSLYREVALLQKPGLVGPLGCGSHDDMNFQTFVRSLQALRDYFPRIAACGAGQPDFTPLRDLGIAAERRMLAATGGINTHRGAIFNLGLLCAAAGWLATDGEVPTAKAACALVSERWGRAILAGGSDGGQPSHGCIVARRYGSGGARHEAANGFRAAIEIGLPVYRQILRLTADAEAAALQSLFALIADVEDTNLLWRGGPAGLAWARQAAAGFLRAGGVTGDGWRQAAAAIDREFVARRLSPGGSADLLGVTLFLADLERLA